MVECWPPCCWLTLVEPKWPLTQSPLLESTAILDLEEKFSFEDLSSWLPSSPARSPSPAVPLRVVPTLSTTDMKTAGENSAGAVDVLGILEGGLKSSLRGRWGLGFTCWENLEKFLHNSTFYK